MTVSRRNKVELCKLSFYNNVLGKIRIIVKLMTAATRDRGS